VTDTPRLEIRNLVRAFGGRRVVDDVSLKVMPGQVTCLLGPSGCGKSTTLRMIAGIEMQDTGEIWADGKLICDTKYRIPPEEELLDRVGMLGHIDRYPHQLSGGEQQRVALARALAPRPRIMLMDEPFSGLDDRLRDDIRDETLDVLKAEGAAVLLVTHEPGEAMRMADEIALMRGGKIVQQGAPYNIYNAPVDKEAAGFFSDINTVRADVDGALAQTDFGQFLVPGVADGTPVDIVIRPQHLKIDFDRAGRGPNPTIGDGTPARGIVKRARFMGVESLVEFTLDNGQEMKALVPSVFLPKRGTVLWLMIRRDKCFIFPRATDSGT